MGRTVAQKMGVKAGARAIFVNAPEGVVASMRLPELDVVPKLSSELDHIHLFTVSGAELERDLPRLKAHLAKGGALWASWPKGRQLGSDLSLPSVIKIGYRHGLVESTCLSVDATWSAQKFTHPKEGKVYKNSYGQLPR